MKFLKVFFLLLVVSLFITGCGGGGSDSRDSDSSGDGDTATVNVTGTWTGTLDITWVDTSTTAMAVTLTLNQSGNTVTGLFTSPDGTLDLTGTVVNDTLSISYTMPCDSGANPKTASMTFTVSGSTMTVTSGAKLSCSKDETSISGTLTKQ